MLAHSAVRQEKFAATRLTLVPLGTLKIKDDNHKGLWVDGSGRKYSLSPYPAVEDFADVCFMFYVTPMNVPSVSLFRFPCFAFKATEESVPAALLLGEEQWRSRCCEFGTCLEDSERHEVPNARDSKKIEEHVQLLQASTELLEVATSLQNSPEEKEGNLNPDHQKAMR